MCWWVPTTTSNGAPASSAAIAFVIWFSRVAEAVVFLNEPQSISIRLFEAPAVNVSRKQSPSSSRRYMQILAETGTLIVPRRAAG